MTLAYAYQDFGKVEKTEDGLIVHGKATGADLDKDQQICDPKWLAQAMPKWAEIGNIREMHGKVAAGVGLETSNNGSDWALKSLCVDPITQLKIDKKVLTGYSIGIKNGKVVKDAAAPGGRIVGGDIVEISYVDRPCNTTCTFAKFEGDVVDLQDADSSVADFTKLIGITPEEIQEAPGDVLKTLEFIAKRDYTDDQRQAMAKKGQALPGGGFPIKDAADLKNAIQAIGRAKNPAAAKAHIKKRAAALGQTGLIPDSWKAEDPEWEKVEEVDWTKATDEEWTHDPAQIQLLFSTCCALMKAEIDEWTKGEDESMDVSELLTAAQLIACWWKNEANEGEVPQPFSGGNDMDSTYTTLGMDADIVKAAQAEDATDEQKAALKTEWLKALGLDEIKTTITDTVKAATEEPLSGFKEELEAVKLLAAPGGPVKSRTAAEAATATKADGLRSQAEYFRQQAAGITDPVTKGDYLNEAIKADTQADLIEKGA